MEHFYLILSGASLILTIFLIVIVRQRFELERIQREALAKELKELLNTDTRSAGDYARTIGTIERIFENHKQTVEEQVKLLSSESIKAINDSHANLPAQKDLPDKSEADIVKELEPLIKSLKVDPVAPPQELVEETRAIREQLEELKSKFEEMSAVDKFVGLLDDDEEKKSALISAIRRLGNDEIAIRLAVAYPSEGATSILQDIAISGKGNELVGWALEGIANSHRAAGKLEEAEIYYKQALVALENSLGEVHEDIADILDSLSQIALKQGRPIEAEEYLEKSNSIRNKLHGSETTEVAESSKKLADLYVEQGKHHEAKPLYERALEISRKTLGPDHEQCFQLLNKLAELTKSIEQPAETARFYEQMAQLQTGKELHKTLLLLIPVYEATLNFEGLESLYRRLIELCEHKETKDELNKSEHMRSLARVLVRQDNKIEATSVYKEVLEDYESYLGPEHDDVLGVVDELSDLLIEQGYLTVAAPYVMRAFKKTLADTESDKFRRLLGKIKLLAERLVENNEFDVAEDLYQQCLTSMEKLKNPPKKAIIGLLRKIGALLARMEDYEKSEAAMRRAIRITEVLFDEDHPETLILLMQLSHLLLKGGKYEEAEEICKRVLEMRYKILGSEHTDIIETLVELAKICKLQKNETEAEIYEESALEMARSLYGEPSGEFKEIKENIEGTNSQNGITALELNKNRVNRVDHG